MRRQIPTLRGLAILAVVCNHTAGVGLVALIWWGHRYGLAGDPPYLEQIGSLPYYGLIVIQQLSNFSVPAFLFISGFFIAYAARGSGPTLSWKIVRARITNLLWPYVVWSLANYALSLLLGEGYPLTEFLRRLAIGNVSMAYFFVPLLCQFYLLSPIVARLAKTRSCLLLAVSALIQWTVTGLRYLQVSPVALPDVVRATDAAGPWIFASWTFARWAFYFPFGAVCGFHSKRINLWLGRFKWVLLVAMVVLGAVSVLESEALYQATEDYGWARGNLKFSSFLYVMSTILFLLALTRGTIPFTRAIERMGTKSYGIYLLHPLVLGLVPKVIYHIAPWLLASQILLQPVVVTSAVAIPLLFMASVPKSPAKRFYSYLFG